MKLPTHVINFLFFVFAVKWLKSIIYKLWHLVPRLSNLKGKLAEAKFTTKQGRYNNGAKKHKPTATPKLISASLYVEVQFYP